MYAETYAGINSFLIGASKLLVKEGVKRETRGNVCYELPEPAMFKITNPIAREVTIPERKWLKVLPYAESLWIASGRNDMVYITHYLARMMWFSDDGIYMRGGYGPRFRDYNGEREDYQIETINVRQQGSVDQLKFVIECFKADTETRRAVMNFGDPMKDNFDVNEELKDAFKRLNLGRKCGEHIQLYLYAGICGSNSWIGSWKLLSHSGQLALL